jgi:hypothetical protein
MLEFLLLSEMKDANENASEARAIARSASGDVNRVNSKLAALELGVETMLRLLIEKGIFSEAEFCQMAHKVDIEDGVLDGRRDLNRMRKMCTQCHKANPAERGACMWCGNTLQHVTAEAVS